jgi:hypothetical protein
VIGMLAGDATMRPPWLADKPPISVRWAIGSRKTGVR